MGAFWADGAAQTGGEPSRPIQTVPGLPQVTDPSSLCSGMAADPISPVAAEALPRVYVPNRASGYVY